MAKNRERQRENRKLFHAEEKLNSYNEWGISDPTPKVAVNNIIGGLNQEVYEGWKAVAEEIRCQ